MKEQITQRKKIKKDKLSGTLKEALHFVIMSIFTCILTVDMTLIKR